MQTSEKKTITIKTLVEAPILKVWDCWTAPEHITKWYQASDDWHAPYAENILQNGGKFKTTMAAKDGSYSFDFDGIYTNVEIHKLIEYALSDGRKVHISFTETADGVLIKESFEAEAENPIDMQRDGWQAILNNFKKYTESI